MTPTEVKIKLEGGILPRKSTPGAAAYDVIVPQETFITRGRQIIPLGLRIELPAGHEAMIEPRSGFSSNGMLGCIESQEDGIIKNHFMRLDCDVLPGKIDCDYRGIVGIIIHNRDREFILPMGARVAQLTIRKVETVNFVEADELSDTQRGEGGFGHTKMLD